MTNTITIFREGASILSHMPWYTSTLVLLIVALALAIVLVFGIGRVITKMSTLADKLAKTHPIAQTSASEIAALLKARSRPIVFLLWLLSGSGLAIVWFAFPTVTRASCLLMVFLGGVFFLLFAYLIVELWWYFSVRRFHREHPELREIETRQ